MALPEERIRVGAVERTIAALQTPPAARVSWSGVWSGFLIGFGTLLLLSMLGLAVGISAVDVGPGQAPGTGLGIGAAVWGGLSLLISLFVGGLVASRTGTIAERGPALVQGALVWVLATLGLIYLAASGVSLGVSAVGGVLGGLTSSLGSAVGTGASELSGLASGDVDQIVARLGDPRTAETVAAATGMSVDESRTTLADLRARVESARNDPPRAIAEAREGLRGIASRAGQQAAQAAAAAKPYATTTSWVALGTMIVSLLAAIGGALAGRVRPAAWVPPR
jgi:hypothetical protein